MMQRSCRLAACALLCAIYVCNAELVSGADKLVDIERVIPNIKTDIVYATNRNFTGIVLYDNNFRCYLKKEVAEQLMKVQQELNEIGLGLLVWDAYRPLSVQCKLWSVCPDERYVTPPTKGGRHTRGTAVDLTIIHLSDGKQLEMPTGFDDFTLRAWSDYKDVSLEAKKNRLLLRLLMEKHGFQQLPTEWWHFDFHDWQESPVLSVGMHELP